MSKKAGPTPPPAPDPTVVSNAQSASNIATAQAQQKLNMVNTYGPDGSVTYQSDPNAPGGYSQTTALSPGQQQLYNGGLNAQNAATNIANQQIGRVGEALGKPLDTSSLPGLAGGLQLGANAREGLQNSFDQGQSVQGDVGGDLDAARYQNMASVYGQAASRLDPQWQQSEAQNRTRLANQGLSENSTAYQQAMDNFGRSKNDAYNQAIFSSVGAGEDAANSLFARQAAQGQFHNDAANQQYSQNQGAAAFNNTAQGQAFQQQLQASQFRNQARQQGLQEQAYLQNEPLNQFNSLMSSSQVGTPQGIQYSPTNVNGTDVLGAYALNSQAQNANYAAQAANRSSTLGGLFQLGSAAMLSDVRAKTEIRRVGTLDSGLGVYTYRYVSGGPVQMGVMAQEVAAVRPSAVIERPDGLLAVNYGAL